MGFRVYEHKTQYYETDQMGIIHHSNYIRWFEEARCDMMEQLGMGYKRMEECGIISPVLSMYCEYKSMTRFGDTVEVQCILKEYNGIKMTVEYSVTDKMTGELRCVGESRHCFLSREGRPVSLKKQYIEMDKAFRRCLPSKEE
ncbi:MAG: thioesterase family protein [bacterium]|nr:thioesterase family protein [bacterium]